MAEDRMIRASMRESEKDELGSRLSAEPLPQEGNNVHDAFSLMNALVIAATDSGHTFANPRLVRSYVWWQDGLTADSIAEWIATLVEWGEITVEDIANGYDGTPIPVIVIQNKRRFRRWWKRPAFTTAERVAVYARDGGACVNCGATKNLSVDHIHPWSKGGAHDMDNFQTLCRSCNSSKGDRV